MISVTGCIRIEYLYLQIFEIYAEKDNKLLFSNTLLFTSNILRANNKYHKPTCMFKVQKKRNLKESLCYYV